MNNVAKVLKYGAIALFTLSIIGAILSSQKSELSIERPKYSKIDEYKTITTFDGAAFFTTTLASAISCTLIYALGELIDIEDKKGKYLVARFGEVKKDFVVKKGNVHEEYDVNYKSKDVLNAIQTLIDNGGFERKGFIYTGCNEVSSMFYFTFNNVAISQKEKIEIVVQDGDHKNTMILTQSSTMNSQEKFKEAMLDFIMLIVNHFDK